MNLDLVARAERLPRAGETLTGATLERIPGGKGANQALAAARLGADVRLVACVGDDDFAAEALALLEAGGVELTGVRTVPGPTGVAVILVGEDGENQIVVAPGANKALRPADVPAGDGAVLCQLEIPLDTVAAAARVSRPFYVNAAPARAVPDEVLDAAELVVVNRHEREALPSTVRRGRIVLTLGGEGAVLLEGGEERARARPPQIEAVDGTGAGDAFCACLVVSLLEGRGDEEALRRACAAGAIAASRPGAQPSLPTAAEIDAILVV